MKKKIRFGISKIWDIEVEEEDMERICIPDELLTLLSDYFDRNNIKADLELFENTNILCLDCGISLQLDEELQDLRCSQCQANKDENDKKVKVI